MTSGRSRGTPVARACSSASSHSRIDCTWGGCQARESSCWCANAGILCKVKERGSMSKRHEGHVVFCSSHGEMQSVWNRCLPGHGKATTAPRPLWKGNAAHTDKTSAALAASGDLSNRSSRQIAHSSASSPSALRKASNRCMRSSEIASIPVRRIAARVRSPPRVYRSVIYATKSGQDCRGSEATSL